MGRDTIEQMQEKLSLAGDLMESSTHSFIDAGREVGLQLVAERILSNQLRAFIREFVDFADFDVGIIVDSEGYSQQLGMSARTEALIARAELILAQ